MKIRVVGTEEGLYVSVKDLIEVLEASGEMLDRDKLVTELAKATAGASERSDD